MKTATTNCKRCSTPITINFDDLAYTEAVERLDSLNSTSMECPGYHVELEGWASLWGFDEMLVTVYPNEHVAEAG